MLFNIQSKLLFCLLFLDINQSCYPSVAFLKSVSILNIKALGLVVSDKKMFSCFPYISLCKTCNSQGWAHFWSQGHNLNNFGRGQLGDATYQTSRLSLVVSDKKIFKVFISKIYF